MSVEWAGCTRLVLDAEACSERYVANESLGGTGGGLLAPPGSLKTLRDEKRCLDPPSMATATTTKEGREGDPGMG